MAYSLFPVEPREGAHFNVLQEDRRRVATAAIRADRKATEAQPWTDATRHGPWVEHNHHVYSRSWHKELGGAPAALIQGWGTHWRWWVWESCNQKHFQGEVEGSLEAVKTAVDNILKDVW